MCMRNQLGSQFRVHFELKPTSLTITKLSFIFSWVLMHAAHVPRNLSFQTKLTLAASHARESGIAQKLADVLMQMYPQATTNDPKGIHL